MNKENDLKLRRLERQEAKKVKAVSIVKRDILSTCRPSRNKSKFQEKRLKTAAQIKTKRLDTIESNMSNLKPNKLKNFKSEDIAEQLKLKQQMRVHKEMSNVVKRK